jgi:cyclic pyranopterin monophosphate synthase
MKRLTHTNAAGEAHMVDVGEKAVTAREARATAEVHMAPSTLRAIVDGALPKGDVLAVARVAGIMAAKRTPELIPLCHGIALTGVDVTFKPRARQGVLAIEATARATDRTGVEMEALVAASVAALTVYDMVKGVERGVTIERVALAEKTGGKSGHWRR